ncbi:SpoIIE family protein phosphatase [Virgisporangium ochraceum]|uniref:Transcriptional regulator n=1 Tax=Virgisporangium ochraceum TaxID=65505 RepID=A0A8J4A304_9ACTN|nr:SpoIIE family protein phosphatase [Virgisporangium ochraceum]GIJ73268.1 transcriptional regulator [Virgisporangium ochraceum]
MGPLTGPPADGTPTRGGSAGVFEDAGWFRVEEVTSAGSARRAAAEAGRRLGFSETRLGELSIAATELATNLARHAVDGRLLVRYLRRDGAGGVLLVAVDSGPGMVDLDASGRDGHSTSGTLGIGLGAVRRLATRSDGYSLPGRGTVIAAEFWPAAPPAKAPGGADVDGVIRPITGEKVAGDALAVRHTAAGALLLVSDGLGHGPLAATASAAAVEAFHGAPDGSPAAVVEHLHRRMSHTRGAAVAVAAVDRAAGTVRYAGLGNIAGVVVRPGERRPMVSLPGIAGHQRRTVREFEYPLPPGAAVVMHTDGLADRWRVEDYPGLLGHRAVVVAATLLRDAGVRRDDAGILVAAPS